MSASDWLTGLAHRGAATLMRRRRRLPKFLNRMINKIAKNPDGFAFRVVSRALGGTRKSQIPPPTTIPDTPVRVYVGPTNYAGQGFLWARALEASTPRIGARNMAIELPGGFAFRADTSVPVAVYNSSVAWQRAELEAVELFTHVLVESERPLFGSLFHRDVAHEIETLHLRGLSSAFMCHGTDIRSPRTHMRLNRWSPFFDDPRETRVLQADADSNLAMLDSMGRPIFVSTPDLLIDVPEAHWCPIMVDVERWTGGRPILSRPVPVVAHVPSLGATKGTHVLEPALRRLHDLGKIDYRRASGVPAGMMPGLIGDADIVLDPDLIGSYGVAGCEAMAAGRVVIGHVLPEVRRKVRELAMVDLPIVEADPDTFEAMLSDLIASPERMRALAAAGHAYMQAVHSGTMSAAVLREQWIDKD
jgi:hypothetical protein